MSFALPPGAKPTDTLPLTPARDPPVTVDDFQHLLYRPLYWFGTGKNAALNPPRSLARPPRFSNGDETVTITLKPYRWPNGTPVTARDVQFRQNLVTANKTHWAGYVPGAYPDNVVSTSVVNPRTLSLTCNQAYNRTWLMKDELSQITPLPQQAWDKISKNGTVGNHDRTPAGAARLSFLQSQAKHRSSYASNPWVVPQSPTLAITPATWHHRS